MSVEFHFEKLILGGSLESLLYAFVHEIPIVISNPIVPFELETMDYDGDFKFLGYDHAREIYKSEMWDRLSFILSMAGLIMLPNTIKNMRQEDKKLVFATQGNSRTTINYKTLITFDKESDEFLHVYDWAYIRSGSKILRPKISDLEDFVKDVYFYQSKRPGMKPGVKDLVTYSKINTLEINDYEKSVSFWRLKTINMMKEQGLRGTANGYNKKGAPLYYAIKLEHTHREIIKEYAPKFDFKKILAKRKDKGNTWNLATKLFHHRRISISQESSQLQVKV